MKKIGCVQCVIGFWLLFLRGVAAMMTPANMKTGMSMVENFFGVMMRGLERHVRIITPKKHALVLTVKVAI